ncbi:hypothetical protein L3Y34_019448 [Caenorhabditis briggsae]|uniref:Homeobox domain-containing protein n=1 Tax=Caenorhabditis briggsae TaxID=6238 RepID=A0AAE9DPY4_CAEBR|nr:hypothetical protein L3Y34_019448 [Caenorhabditis briggsae]
MFRLTEEIIRQLQRSGAVVDQAAPGRYQGHHFGQVQCQFFGQAQGQVGAVFGLLATPLIAPQGAVPAPPIFTTIDMNFVARAQILNAAQELQIPLQASPRIIPQSPTNLHISIPNPLLILAVLGMAPSAPPVPPPESILCRCGFSIKSKKSSCQFKRRVFNCLQTAILNARFETGFPVTLQEKLMFAKEFKVTMKRVITWFGKRSRKN